MFRDFPTFSRICICFLLTLLSSNLSLLSASSLLCFSSVHIVGSLTSKLPSIIVLKVIEVSAYQRILIIEGSLEVKLPTIWTDEKQSREEAERRGRLEERRVEEKE